MLRGLGGQKAKGPQPLLLQEEEVSRGKDLLKVFHPERGGSELQGLLGPLPFSYLDYPLPSEGEAETHQGSVITALSLRSRTHNVQAISHPVSWRGGSLTLVSQGAVRSLPEMRQVENAGI